VAFRGAPFHFVHPLSFGTGETPESAPLSSILTAMLESSFLFAGNARCEPDYVRCGFLEMSFSMTAEMPFTQSLGAIYDFLTARAALLWAFMGAGVDCGMLAIRAFSISTFAFVGVVMIGIVFLVYAFIQFCRDGGRKR
jgi:hypothetical protein